MGGDRGGDGDVGRGVMAWCSVTAVFSGSGPEGRSGSRAKASWEPRRREPRAAPWRSPRPLPGVPSVPEEVGCEDRHRLGMAALRTGSEAATMPKKMSTNVQDTRLGNSPAGGLDGEMTVGWGDGEKKRGGGEEGILTGGIDGLGVVVVLAHGAADAGNGPDGKQKRQPDLLRQRHLHLVQEDERYRQQSEVKHHVHDAQEAADVLHPSARRRSRPAARFDEAVLGLHRSAFEQIQEQGADDEDHQQGKEGVVGHHPFPRRQTGQPPVEQGDGDFDQADGDKKGGLTDARQLPVRHGFS